MRIITSEKQKQTVRDVRSALSDLLTCSVSAGIADEQVAALKDTLNALEDSFLVVVVGEFNAGKSSLINTLLNTAALKEGVTPTTAQINLIRYGEGEKQTLLENGVLLLELPAELLKTISFVDTPGTNAVITEHEVLTRRFLPRADLVFFITSCDRPLTQTESTFLQDIRSWGKKVVILLNKTDLLEDPADREHVAAFVSENVERILGNPVPVLPVSARSARRARSEMSEALWKESGFADLEQFIQDKINEEVRFAIKMNSALGVGETILKNTTQKTDDELKFYREDKKLADSIRSQVDLYKGDMDKEVSRSMREIHSVFDEIRQRGNQFFDKMFSVRNIPGLIKQDKNKLAFQQDVLQGMPVEIERKTSETVEMLSIQQQRMIHSIRSQIETRKTQYPAGGIPEQARSERAELLQRMQSTIDGMLDKIQTDLAADIGMKHAQTAVTAGLAIEVSAIGIGAALTALTTTAVADILGIFAALWVGVAGLLVLPYYKRKSQKEFAEKIGDIESKLTSSLESEFRKEIGEQTDEMYNTLRPFERFVDGALDTSRNMVETLDGLRTRIDQIKHRLES